MIQKGNLAAVGFEPTPPKRLEPKTSALDHSYTLPDAISDIITSKANRILGLIKRTCRGWKDTETLKTLYCTLVRSQVEYGSVVWSPYTSRNIDKLERIQRRGTKFFLGQIDISYEDRL